MGMVLYMQVTEKNVVSAITVHHGSTDRGMLKPDYSFLDELLLKLNFEG